ncbi:outer membrane beta-barrel protein [Vibrio sp. NTOU-M3]|uniref:outer membrane beta-barrel protein n=1 Tax=Vibrio sp. NTOU-M3 TaxID=3234954 RepID=UPI00349F6034
MIRQWLGLVLMSFTSLSYANTDNFDNFYLGLASSFSEVDINGVDQVDDKPDISSVGVIFGYQPSKYFAIEARELVRVSSRSDMFDGQGSLLARGIVPIHEYFALYGVGGISGIYTSGFDDLETDVTYGAGFRIKKGSPLYLDVEYRRLYSGDFVGSDIEVNSVNLNIVYGF